jgi:hypothetical protein
VTWSWQRTPRFFEFRDQLDKKGIDVWYISSEFSSFGLFVKYVCIFNSEGSFVRSMVQDYEKLDRSQWQSLREKTGRAVSIQKNLTRPSHSLPTAALVKAPFMASVKFIFIPSHLRFIPVRSEKGFLYE